MSSSGGGSTDQDVCPSASPPKDRHLNAPQKEEPLPSWSSVVEIHKEFLSSFPLLQPKSLQATQAEWKHPLLQKSDEQESTKSSRNYTDKQVSVKRQQLHQKLQDLQRQRILLASEMAKARSAVSAMKRPSQVTDQPQVMQDNSTGNLWTTDINKNNDGGIITTNLAHALQTMRTKRKRTAAYRLGGITAAVPHDDPEVLSLRFDICLNGIYVACYHAFLDLIVGTTATTKRSATMATTAKPKKKKRKRKQISTTPTTSRKRRPKKDVDDDSDYDSDDVSSSTSDDDSTTDAEMKENDPQPTANNIDNNPRQLYVRLTQHTIPSAIPLADICESTLGGSLYRLGENEEEEWNTGEFQKRLKLFGRQCYRACTAWEQRKQAWEFLMRKQQQHQDSQKEKSDSCCISDGTSCRGHLEVSAVSTPASNALNQVSFQLSWRWCQKSSSTNNQSSPLPVGTDCHEVTLIYGDCLVGLPSSVKVVSAAAAAAAETHNRRGRTLSQQPFQAIQSAFLKEAVEMALNRVGQSWRERAKQSKLKSQPRR